MTQFDQQDDKKKGGILAALLKLFGGSSSGSSLPGTALSGGLGGLFTSKAGIMGVVLGGATIAAGIGVIYNFIGPSSKPVYSPGLFQDSYYESVAGDAQAERSAQYGAAKRRSSSSLDYFSEEARKGDIAGLASEGASSSGEEGAYGGASASAAADADGAATGGTAAGTGAKPSLVTVKGFGSGSGTPRMKRGGGLSGGIGSKSQSIFKAPIKRGKFSAMSGSVASRRTSGKRRVPQFNKKGAYGQAKYAGVVSKGASYSSSDAGAKTTAQEAFEGKTAGSGDVAGIDSGGAGLGGAGLGSGGGLQASDPSLNTNTSTPPAPPVNEPSDDSPWKKTTDLALYGMLAAAALILLTRIFAKMAHTGAMWMITAAKICAYGAMLAAAVVIYAGVMLMSKYGQKWMGLMYVAVGAILIWQAYQALMAAEAAGDQLTIDKGLGDKGFTKASNGQWQIPGTDGTNTNNFVTQDVAVNQAKTMPVITK